MALLDLESLGSQLREIKISQLDPELLDSVLELVADHGEITIASSTDLHFLVRIYRAEYAREVRDVERLEKAENLILTLAGMRPLHHDDNQQSERPRGFEGRKALSNLMTEGAMNIGVRERALFESIGISDEREMQKAIGILGEEKVAERVRLAATSKLGLKLARLVFCENPSVLSTPKDEDFEIELRSMENKKSLIDKWADVSGEPLPVWADYSESPNVLLVHYANLYRALVLGSKDKKAEGFAAGPENDLQVIKMLQEIGLSIEEKGGSLRITCPDGREIWVAQQDVGALEPERPANDERTAPDRPSAMAHKPRSRSSDTSILSALRDMGIDITRLSAELERISDSSDPVSRSKEQEKFEKSVAAFHDLLKSGRLGPLISPRRIAKAAYMTGANGAFELTMDGGAKKLYLHLQDMEPARIGKFISESEGLVSYDIRTGDGFAVSEDAREVGDRGMIRLRMPDTFRFEQAQTVGSAVFKEDLVLRPDPRNPMHADYYSRLSSEEGRKEVLGALLAYFEMSRRALLPDRRPSNTFVLQVERAGKRTFTFQPTDLDGIGNFIGTAEGKPDFKDFNHDFQKAAADFAVQMHEGMLRAAETGMVKGEIPAPSQILSEMTPRPLPPDDSDLVERRDALLRENDGRPIGIGFDASSIVGEYIPSQGGNGKVLGTDGRVALEADRAVWTAHLAAGAQDAFIEGFIEGARKSLGKMPKRIAEIAVAMAENPDGTRISRLRNMSGGEIAYSIYDSLPLGSKKSLYTIALKEAQGRIDATD